MRPYEQIADQVPVLQLTPRERGRVNAMLDSPTPEYKLLVRLLDRDGCKFPKVQAALMQLNTPGVAAKILADG